MLVPSNAFRGGAIKWLCNDQIDPEAEMTFGVVYINAGEGNPTHYHPNCEELIYVLSGECDHKLGDEVIPLRARNDVTYSPERQT